MSDCCRKGPEMGSDTSLVSEGHEMKQSLGEIVYRAK